MSAKWDARFIELATLVATWSKDPSTKVGAVIVDGKRIVSLGFNGFPAGVEDEPELYRNRDIKLARVLHAEQNAIAFAKRDLSRCTIYVTHMPCSRCTAQIIQEGIKRIVCQNPYADSAYINKWRESVEHAEAMCEQAGVEIAYYP